MIFTNENYSVTIHTNARERLEVPPFMRKGLNPRISLESYDMVASNTVDEGFPTARVTGNYRTGSFFFEVRFRIVVDLSSLMCDCNDAFFPTSMWNLACSISCFFGCPGAAFLFDVKLSTAVLPPSSR